MFCSDEGQKHLWTVFMLIQYATLYKQHSQMERIYVNKKYFFLNQDIHIHPFTYNYLNIISSCRAGSKCNYVSGSLRSYKQFCFLIIICEGKHFFQRTNSMISRIQKHTFLLRLHIVLTKYLSIHRTCIYFFKI